MYVAPPNPKNPITHKFVGKRKRHNHQPQEEVSDSQRRNEPVLYIFQRLLRSDRDDNEHITHDDDNHKHRNHDGSDDNLRQGVAAGVVESDGGVGGAVESRVVHLKKEVLDGFGRPCRQVGERHLVPSHYVQYPCTRSSPCVGDNVKRNNISLNF